MTHKLDAVAGSYRFPETEIEHNDRVWIVAGKAWLVENPDGDGCMVDHVEYQGVFSEDGEPCLSPPEAVTQKLMADLESDPWTHHYFADNIAAVWH